MAPSRSTVVRLRSKGEPLPDAYEKAQGARSARGAVLRARPKTRHHLGPVLYHLPPHWPRNLQRLETFLHTLPKNRLHAIEFRDPTWYSDETFEMLRRHKVTLCLHDMAGSSTGRQLIGPFVYLRLHGPQRYAGRYSDHALEAWAEWCVNRRREGMMVYAYFNNDVGGHAPRDALRLRELCARYDTVQVTE